MDLATIRHLAREQATKARRHGKKPFIVEEQDLEDWKLAHAAGRAPRFPFPNIGTYVPKGWKATDRDPLFCDKMGDGDNGRSAGILEILGWLRPGYGYAIIEEGEFQLYLGEFEPLRESSGTARPRRANTLLLLMKEVANMKGNGALRNGAVEELKESLRLAMADEPKRPSWVQ